MTMKYSLIALSIAVLTVAGCGRTTVRETVIEKQVPVAESRKEIIVQTPPVTREIIVQSPTMSPQRSCNYSAADFYAGTLSCQRDKQVRCEDGKWIKIGTC